MMMITETLAQITAPHFCAGIDMKRWSRDRVRDYCASKGWRIVVVHQIPRIRP
jgi:hypothetical protein